MALTPLSESEQAAADALVRSGRVEQVAADATRAKTFVARAAAGAESVNDLKHTDIAYNVAYDACHDVGEAVLAAYGYRTRAGNGQHEAVGRFLKAVFTTPPGSRAATSFDQLRRARNKNRYDAAPVGKAQVEHATAAARDLVAAARARGVGE